MKYKVGDKVRVRKWDDMVKEFGVDGDGDIDCNSHTCFIKSMKGLCGKEFVVEEVEANSYYLGYEAGDYDFTDEMLETVEQKEAVNHPSHYQGKYECIDMMIVMFGVEAVKHFCMCNSFKYRFRAEQKNGAEDIRKAEWYENMMMELDSGLYFARMAYERDMGMEEFYREMKKEKKPQ